MLRSLVLMGVFAGLLWASAESVDVRNLLAIAGAFGICWTVDRWGRGAQ